MLTRSPRYIYAIIRHLAIIAISGASISGTLVAEEKSPFARWEEEIAALERKGQKEPHQPNGILFVGSSSIRLWDLPRSFPGYRVINHGFGGSQIADSTHFAPRIIIKYDPRTVVLYAGDNDIAAGKSPERVCDDFKAFVKVIHAALPAARISYISIKPSVLRWNLWDKMKRANHLIEAYCKLQEHLQFIDISKAMLGADGRPRKEWFLADGLHLNPRGYDMWAKIVGPYLE